MGIQTRTKRLFAALALTGVGLAVGAEATQAGLVDVNGLLRLLDVYDLNPLF